MNKASMILIRHENSENIEHFFTHYKFINFVDAISQKTYFTVLKKL